MFFAFFFNHSSTAARMHHPTERCRSLANFSKPWSCSALSRILKISILMYDSVLHNDTGVNRKVPQPQSATRLPPPEGGGLRSGAVHQRSFKPNWTWRDVVDVLVITPAVGE